MQMQMQSVGSCSGAKEERRAAPRHVPIGVPWVGCPGSEFPAIGSPPRRKGRTQELRRTRHKIRPFLDHAISRCQLTAAAHKCFLLSSSFTNNQISTAYNYVSPLASSTADEDMHRIARVTKTVFCFLFIRAPPQPTKRLVFRKSGEIKFVYLNTVQTQTFIHTNRSNGSRSKKT